MKTIGYFLGLLIGAPLVFFLISYIFLRPRNIEEIQILNYIDNSEKKLLKEPIPYLSKYDGDDERLGGSTISKTTYFSNRNMSYLRGDSYIFFSKELNKYVQTLVISEGAYLNKELLDFGNSKKNKNVYPDIIFYYNKIQNEDPSYGTIDKPLPILHFRSANPALRSMRKENKDTDEAYLKKVYEENVKLYLQYFIDKEDFKKLFPKE
ncbi:MULTISPECIES: hypothetical protein [Empedobacter]|uniref:DUF8188 domain-containing protein n=1 Tax=Empedobacter falsenii TaxID=343874 RepID=A0A7H9DUL6_9FLAO|nr:MULTISPECIES: hypothetical protein [Empedobacter]MDH2205908.1 hypothetical protein [Empedobacter sp. GD03644]QLL58800.1 hypothetical protein FH779_12160 [Empedobacter falsenii]